MYVLRMISAVLHRQTGVAVSENALDLRPAELAILVPLVALLLFLSAWPAAITDRAVADSAKRYCAAPQPGEELGVLCPEVGA
jgi:NADH:ubiquinone oxidoreductase subunit 4 (subunit M)